jgi:hypothetical protein
MIAMVFGLVVLVAQAQSSRLPAALPIAQKGLRCPSGGRAIGDPVAKTFILQELQIVSRDANRSVLGFIYSGADGQDYLDLTPSNPHAYVHLMGDSEVDKSKTMMVYCFSKPWMRDAP